jgi:hypothetical protein
MFELVYENLRAATDASIRLQQEIFRKWAGLWPATPAPGGNGEQLLGFHKRWAAFLAEQAAKARETLEAQFSAGLKNIEEAFRLAEAKGPEELHARTVELWQKSFDCLRKTYEAQVRDFQAAVAKWTELMTRGAA